MNNKLKRLNNNDNPNIKNDSNKQFDIENRNKLKQNFENTKSHNENNSKLIEHYNIKKTASLNGDITTVLKLNNNKAIVICTSTGYLLIYDINLFKLKLSIELISDNPSPINTILDIIEFKENNFCLSCWDYIIRYIELN